MRLQIYEANDEEEILSSYKRITQKDIHFDLDYLKIFSKYHQCDIFYTKYGDNDDYLMVPYFLRPIDDHFDLISPWYYGGPIFTTENRTKRIELYKKFRKEFPQICKERSVISEFMRFNPLFDNFFPEVDKGSLTLQGQSIVINVSWNLDRIRKDFKDRVKKNVHSGRNKGLEIEVTNDKNLYPIFKEIYLKTMKDINASNFYLFNNEFFDDILKTFEKDMIMYFVKWNGKRISGTVDLGRYGIIHDFLRGTLREYMKLNPNYILMVRMIEEAHKRGFKEFSIGGGRTNKPNDSLFFFKSSFSKDIRNSYVFKNVYDKKAYKSICNERKLGECLFDKASFFPEYRAGYK